MSKKSTRKSKFGYFFGYLILNLLIFSIGSGETGIRTPGTSRYNGFQDRRNRPLCHLSKTLLRVALFFKGGAKVGIIFYFANKRGKNYLDTL